MYKLNCTTSKNKIILNMEWVGDMCSNYIPSVPTKIIKELLYYLQNKFAMYEMAPPVRQGDYFLEDGEPCERIKFKHADLLFTYKKEKYFYKIDSTYLKLHELTKDSWIDIYEENKEDIPISFDLFAEIGNMIFDSEFYAVAVTDGKAFFEKLRAMSYIEFEKHFSDLIELAILNDNDQCWEITCKEPLMSEILAFIRPMIISYNQSFAL